ncbi:OLC1v1008846C1 [Oldenlandia corymbosa var. corymbosa]|uniref:OLC1v1008846C1 n=1 Tax=Oldenlandia corymbosa var. corymbosa TaxID=529605 RepID=A0AAV1DPY9_OLDCO|nr:OLC1v1008846C1 [Oldenlandia corymbosa var. corymbosa]
MVAATVHNRRGTLNFLIFDSENNRWRGWRSGHALYPPNNRNEMHKLEKLSEPVYLNNRMHWLMEKGDVLVFNLITEQPSIIQKPDVPHQSSPHGNGNIFGTTYNSLGLETWLGIAEGYLAYVIPKEEEILRGKPIFWDGKILVFIGGDLLKDVFQFQVLGSNGGKWESCKGGGIASDVFIHLFRVLPPCRIPGISTMMTTVPVGRRMVVEKLVEMKSLVACSWDPPT